MECDTDTCRYHALTEAIITDLKDAITKLAEGQEQMKETIIHLSEGFKAMERLDRRLERMECLHREKNKEQDAKIDELRVFMYKAIGALAAIGAAASILAKFIGMG